MPTIAQTMGMQSMYLSSLRNIPDRVCHSISIHSFIQTFVSCVHSFIYSSPKRRKRSTIIAYVLLSIPCQCLTAKSCTPFQPLCSLAVPSTGRVDDQHPFQPLTLLPRCSHQRQISFPQPNPPLIPLNLHGSRLQCAASPITRESVAKAPQFHSAAKGLGS